MSTLYERSSDNAQEVMEESERALAPFLEPLPKDSETILFSLSLNGMTDPGKNQISRRIYQLVPLTGITRREAVH